MARIAEVGLTNVRCFEGTQRARMARITLLVGENGTGKSTFLGCYHALAKLANLHRLPEANHFDAEPFKMGGFASIARNGCGEFGLSAEFVDHVHSKLFLSFEERRGRPVDREIRTTVLRPGGTPTDLTLLRPSGGKVALRVTGPGFTFDLRPNELSYESIAAWLSGYVRDGHLPFSGNVKVFRAQTRNERGSPRDAAFIRFLEALKRFDFPDPSTFVASAADPQLPRRLRTYREEVPGFNPDDRDFRDFLGTMGRRIQLWEGIDVDSTADGRGYSIMVRTSDGLRNLVDVGYGVHSLLVHFFPAFYRAPANAVFLLQQPEIHVHPRAQAALAQWMAESNLGFAIETHSDHFADRFRICVSDGTLDPDDLSILYFESSDDGKTSNIHSIRVDCEGNLENVPNGYRKFFLQETHRLLGFE